MGGGGGGLLDAGLGPELDSEELEVGIESELGEGEGLGTGLDSEEAGEDTLIENPTAAAPRRKASKDPYKGIRLGKYRRAVTVDEHGNLNNYGT